MCKICKLSARDLESMTVGMAINHIEEYMNIKFPRKEQEQSARNASQSDFDNF